METVCLVSLCLLRVYMPGLLGAEQLGLDLIVPIKQCLATKTVK
jgi:hypothetical protein